MHLLNESEQRAHAAAVLLALQNIETALEGSVAANGYHDVTYQFPVDFDGNDTQLLISHPTLRGRVVDFAIHSISENMDAAETVVIGTTGDNDEFASIAVPQTAAATGSVHPAVTQGVTSIIPAGTTIEIENSSTGTTGIGTMAITIRYFP